MKRRSKYGAVPTVYAGVRFHSAKEARYAATLNALKSAKDPSERVERIWLQWRVPLNVGMYHVCDFVPDFRVEYADGRVELHEVKGVETREYKLKVRLFRALYPDAVLRIIK